MFYRIPELNYTYASSLDEALELVERLSDYKLLAGGTDLIIDMKTGRAKPRNIIDISRIKELRFIKDEGGYVRIGSLITLQELAESPIIKGKAPVLSMAANEMASWQIRNMATVGGNLCNASPAADSAPPLMVLNAKLVLVSKRGEREVPITQFFKGPRKTALRKDELLKEIVIPYETGSGQYYIKLGRRNAFTLSVVSVASLVKINNGKFGKVRIALNSVAPTPVRSRSVEEALKSKEVTYEVIKRASEKVLNDISPISDVRASANYRKEMSIVLTRDVIVNALKQLGVEVRGR